MSLSLVLASLVGGYLLGTLPTAYIAVKLTSGQDIRATGSGNVGAMNSFEITGSKWTGFIVFLVDALKGVAAVLVARLLVPNDSTGIWYESIGLFGAIAGHNYNLWLSISTKRLAGGKGLATACGGLALIWPVAIVAWCALFLAGFYGFKLWRGVRSIIPGNLVATTLLPVPMYFLYGTVALIAVVAFAVAILPKHWSQTSELLAPTSA